MSRKPTNFDGIQSIQSPRIEIFNGPGKSRTIPEAPEKKKSKLRAVFLWTAGLLVVASIVVLGARAFGVSSKVFVGEKSSFFKQIADVIKGTTGHLTLSGEKDGQINVLLLGIGGQGHNGAYLSDTIILAQIRPEDQSISMTSIPRDYLASIKGYGDRKINAAFAEGYARNKNWNEAGELARQTVGEVAGVDIPYFAVVDFSGFKKAIDTVGGVDIQIDNTFTDYQYPDENEGYLAPVTFTKGLEHMNGERALIFSRSRHGNNGEGSDFKRSQRQQKIIQATKQRVIDLNLISDLGTVNELVSVFADHFHTNLSAGELLHLYDLSKDFPNENISSLSLDPSTGLICSGIVEETGAYILKPCYGKTKQDITDFFKNSFLIGKMKNEAPVIWVATTSPTSRAFKQTEKKLAAYGATVWPIQYTEVTPQQSIIYSLNEKPATEQYIKNILNARTVTIPPPGMKIDASKSDIIVILGSDIKLDPLPPPPPPKQQEDTTKTSDQTETTDPDPQTTPDPNAITQ